MRLKIPGSLGETVEALKNLVNDADTVLTSWPALARGNLEHGKTAYLRWVETASLTIGNYLLDDDLLSGLRAHAYWRIYDLTDDDPRPYPVVEHELRLQQRHLNSAIACLENLKPFLEREGSIVMPDTSAFIQGRYFMEFDWASELDIRPLPLRLVVPGLVIEELEKLKSFDRDVKHRARQVLKDLRRLLVSVKPGEAVRLRDNVTIEALIDEDRHQRLANHDGEIIDQAVQVQALAGQSVTIVCLDLPMELRARLRGVKAVSMPEKDEAKETAR